MTLDDIQQMDDTPHANRIKETDTMSVVSVQQRQPKYHNMPATSAQYFALEDDGFRYELIEGRLQVMPSPLTIHQSVVGELLVEMKLFLRTDPIGEVYSAPLDVELGPIDTYQPDLLFIHNDNQYVTEGPRVHGAPDLVVEILSSSTRSNR